MSVASAAPTSSVAVSWSPKWITDRIGGVVLHIAVISLTLAWMVPSLSVIQRGDQLTATELVGEAAATLISLPPQPGIDAG